MGEDTNCNGESLIAGRSGGAGALSIGGWGVEGFAKVDIALCCLVIRVLL